MSFKKATSLSLISRLTLGNILIVSVVLGVSILALYQYACNLVGDIQGVNAVQQQSFNQTLLTYVLILLFVSIVIGSIFYFYFVKKIIMPIRHLADSTEGLIKGEFPAIESGRQNNEISRLTNNFNRLSEKLKEIEVSRAQLVTTTAHELRTPLSNINGYLEGIKKGIIQGDHALFDALHKESERLIHLVDELYKLSEWELEASEDLHKEQIEIKELMEQSVLLFRWELEEKGLQMTVDMEGAEIIGDKEQLQQVSMNLLQNAIEHQQQPSPISIRGIKGKQYYTTYVEVIGEPIDPYEKHKIFERYFHKDRSLPSQEKGIGLAIVKEIVQKHDGLFGVETDGTHHQFWFALPY